MAPVNLRKELRTFVGQVLREGGEDPSLASSGRRKGKGKGKAKGKKGLKGKGKQWDKGKGKGPKGGKGGKGDNGGGKGKKGLRDVGGASRTPRRLLRKQQRREKKARREHFFGGSKSEKEPVKPQTPSGKAGKAKATPKSATKKRKRIDDDEEITSEDEGEKQDKDQNSDEDAEVDEGNSDGGEENAESEEPKASDAEDEAAESHPQKESESYVPPHLRGKRGDGIQTLQRTLRGILNRVSEGNLDPSGVEIVKVLSSTIPEMGTAKAADAFTSALLSAAVEDPNISVLVLGCFAALVAACQVVFGPSFGASALLKCLDLLQTRLRMATEATDNDPDPDEVTNTDARVAKNCVIFCMLLFSFGILPGNVVFDVVRFVMKRPITEISAELSLTILRYSGRQLRSECPDDFREVLHFVTAEANEARQSSTEASGTQSRLDYLLKELNDLKNNKAGSSSENSFVRLCSSSFVVLRLSCSRTESRVNVVCASKLEQLFTG